MRRRIVLSLTLFAAACLATGGVRADFLRGDVNQDGRVDVSDAVSHVRYLFKAGDAPTCEDAADSNDDGKLSIDDAVATLLYLFAEGSLPNPGPLAMGPDPTCDTLRCESAPDPTPAIVLNEIHYNPSGDIQKVEYLELFNRSPGDVSLKGWRFTKGIDFAFADDVVMPAGSFLLVLKDPDNTRWRRLTTLKAGPYEGNLAEGGERVTLEHDDCDKETVKYEDRAPWPVSPDGGGPSLERIDVMEPAEDFHAWRGSVKSNGTPGEVNSSIDTPARPVIVQLGLSPEHPNSQESVTVEIVLDAPAMAIAKATLHWEAVAASTSAPQSVELTFGQGDEANSLYRAVIPPQPSQTLVRMVVDVELADGRHTQLPHRAEPRAFLSYFVHDGEMPSKFPRLWIFPKRKSGLPFTPSRLISGVVILEPSIEEGGAGPGPAPVPLVLDGTDIRSSTQGNKIRFVKGGEYNDYRTLNMVPEGGGGGTGTMAPHMEHFGFKTFRDLGAVAPNAMWFRVIDYGSASARNTQRLLIEQVNERFLARAGLSPDGDLYKLDKSSFGKRTNPETAGATLVALQRAINSADAAKRREAVLTLLDLDSVGLYSIVSILIENWDGFHNNLYLYNELTPEARWKVIPWDLDQVFEPQRFDFPVTFPLTGSSPSVSRETGPISKPYHLQPDLNDAYLEGMRLRIQPDGPFTVDKLKASLNEVEASLLADLELQETYLGTQRAARRAQIKSAYAAMRTFVEKRVPYLESVLKR